jgi:histidinol-phosphate phosphatase family protein
VRRVRSLFTWDRVASRLTDVYRSVQRDESWRVEQTHVHAAARPPVSVVRNAAATLAPPAAVVARRPAVFLDKDGTLIEDVPYNVDPARLRFTPRALPALRLLAQRGWALVVVSNQAGLALGRFTLEAFERLRDELLRRVHVEAGVSLAGFHFCPHAPAADGTPACPCRKPAPGLLLQAAMAHRLDLERSWMVGDILDDVEAGQRAGCRSVLLDVGHETQWRPGPLRTPHHRCADLWDAAQIVLGRTPDAQAAPYPPSAALALASAGEP